MFIWTRQDTLLPGLILLLDNKDSFVWNLAQALQGLGADLEVVRSDRMRCDEVARFQALVLSPGPGRPEQAGICVPAVQRYTGRLPILGICLGHQAIGLALGASVDRGPPVHGRTSAIHHDGDGIFRGLPSPFAACRYHSLYVARTLAPALRGTAHLADGAVMAVRHASHPTFGLQFHPESFRSEHGTALLRNFLAEVA